jgi:hypothetical protein
MLWYWRTASCKVSSLVTSTITIFREKKFFNHWRIEKTMKRSFVITILRRNKRIEKFSFRSLLSREREKRLMLSDDKMYVNILYCSKVIYDLSRFFEEGR